MIELVSQTKQYGNGDVPQHIVNGSNETFLEVLMDRVYVAPDKAPK
jgi:hypothetical protein